MKTNEALQSESRFHEGARQFIVLTPNDLLGVTRDANTRVVRLANPKLVNT